MHIPEPAPDVAFETDLLAYDDALATGRTPPGTWAHGGGKLGRARSLLDRLERDRHESRDARADPTSELARLLHAEGLLDHPAAAGAPFGRFRLLRELGRGGCGIVFLAHDPVLRRDVALKVPRLDVLVRPEARRRFVREGRAAAGLTHRNIISVLEAGEVGAVGYIASAYCPGPTLSRWLAAQKAPVPPRQAAALVAAVADALQHAHARGVIHRDLKPSNILLEPGDAAAVDPAGGAAPLCAFTPKVSDFGLAKQAMDVSASGDDAPTVSLAEGDALTRTGHVLGTPGYMAPEQAAGGAERAGPAADVYSLGVILYELLTGRLPSGDAASGEPLSPRRSRADVPRWLEVICLKCLHPRPERRYESMAALADDLGRWLRGEPILARPAPATERVVLWARRRPAAAAVLGSGLIAAAVLLAGLLWHYHELGERNVALQQALDKADRERVRAEAGEQAASDHGYAAQVVLADHVRADGRLGPLRELLNALRPAPDQPDPRGFEWHFLWAVGGAETRLRGAGGAVLAVAFADDERRCHAVDTTGVVHTWDVGEARLASRWDGRPSPGGGAFFSADGARLLTSDDPEGGPVVQVGDPVTRQVLASRAWPGLEFHAAAFAPDGRTAAFATRLPGRPVDHVLLWSPDSGAEQSLCPWPEANITQIAFSADGTTLAVASHKGHDPAHPARVDCVDVTTGRTVSSLPAGPFPVSALAFSPDGRHLALGCQNRTVRVRDVATGRDVAQVPDAKEPAASFAWSADGALLAAGTRPKQGGQGNCFVHVWDLSRGAALFRPLFHQGAGVRTMVFSRTGRTLLLGDQERDVYLYDLAAPPPETVLDGHRPDEAWSVAFTPDGKTLVSGGDDHHVKLWDPRAAKHRATLVAHDEATAHGSLVTHVAVAGDGRHWASASYDAFVRVWDAATGECVRTIPHPGRVWSVAFSKDGRHLASGAPDGTAFLWDALTGRELRRLSGHNRNVRCAFSADDELLVSASGDRVQVWEVAGGRRVAHWSEAGQANCAAFSPDGKVLAVGTNEASIVLRRSATGAELAVLHGHGSVVRALAFSPDGKTLVSGSDDRTVRLWHLATGRELVCLKGLPHRINSLAFSPDGQTLAAAIHDGTIRLWQAPR